MTTAAPAQPQTTGQTGTGPFIEFSEPGKGRIYDLTSQPFGQLITTPLVALPGWLRNFRLRFTASGGASNSTVTSAAAADAPYNVVQMLQVWDALGTPIYALPGYEALKLIPLFSGGFGTEESADVAFLPSFSAVATGAATTGTGNFQFASCIPFEFAKGVGVIGAANGDALPKIQIQLNPSSSVYTTAPLTLPSIEVRVNSDYYWLPTGENVSPPGLGSTRQWFLQQGYPGIGNGSVATVTIPRQGGYLDTMIFIMRDSNNARIDGWPTILRFKIDGIGTIETYLDEIYDDMAIAWGFGCTNQPARPTGVIALTRKTSLGQRVLGLLDTYEAALSTSSGTSMTLEGAPWGTVTNAPATLSAILGQVIPSGALTRGLVEA